MKHINTSQYWSDIDAVIQDCSQDIKEVLKETPSKCVIFMSDQPSNGKIDKVYLNDENDVTLVVDGKDVAYNDCNVEDLLNVADRLNQMI